MPRKRYTQTGLARSVEHARERHRRTERERVEREEAAERASGRRRPDVLELAAERTRATHELEEAERFYISDGIGQFEALLADTTNESENRDA